jgi:hypothetical protein
MMAGPSSAWSGCGLNTAMSCEVEDHGDAVTVLPFDPVRHTALLVRILRVPALLSAGRSELLERPAGIMEEADPEQTALPARA